MKDLGGQVAPPPHNKRHKVNFVGMQDEEDELEKERNEEAGIVINAETVGGIGIVKRESEFSHVS